MAQEDPILAPTLLRLQAGVETMAEMAPGETRPEGKRYGPGDRIAENYRLRRLLGQGGMGDVWLAHNEALDVDVAIKLVRPASGEKDAAESLLREARAAARLGHPAIVRVFDFGQTKSGDPYIVMERLEGEDLATALGRLGQLRPAKAVRTLLPIAHALMAAHGKGIVHRDLKPENVFLARVEGDRLQPKVVDFGIAQVDRGTASGATPAGGLLGSPAYMAPEQARSGDVDHRADVWSFCVLLYEVIAGSRPFTGDTPEAILRAIVSADPPSLLSVPGVDDTLFAIIRKGLEKSPKDRFATMKELGEALSAWLLATGVTKDITGASLGTVWGDRVLPVQGDLLGSLRPPPLESPKEERPESATLIRGARRPQTKAGASKLVAVTAGVAALLGIGLGVLVGGKPARAPAVRSDASAAPRPVAIVPVGAAGTQDDPKKPALAELSGQTPAVGAEATASLNAKSVAKSKRKGPSPPKRTLKDPFR